MEKTVLVCQKILYRVLFVQIRKKIHDHTLLAETQTEYHLKRRHAITVRVLCYARPQGHQKTEYKPISINSTLVSCFLRYFVDIIF